jgi:hypothetical protein
VGCPAALRRCKRVNKASRSVKEQSKPSLARDGILEQRCRRFVWIALNFNSSKPFILFRRTLTQLAIVPLLGTSRDYPSRQSGFGAQTLK